MFLAATRNLTEPNQSKTTVNPDHDSRKGSQCLPRVCVPQGTCYTGFTRAMPLCTILMVTRQGGKPRGCARRCVYINARAYKLKFRCLRTAKYGTLGSLPSSSSSSRLCMMCTLRSSNGLLLWRSNALPMSLLIHSSWAGAETSSAFVPAGRKAGQVNADHRSKQGNTRRRRVEDDNTSDVETTQRS